MGTKKVSHICSCIDFFHKVLHDFEVKNTVSSNKRKVIICGYHKNKPHMLIHWFFHKVLHDFEVKNSVSSNKRKVITCGYHKNKPHMLIHCFNSFMFSLVNIYLFKVKNGDTRIMYQICSKLIIKKLRWRYWPRSGIFIVVNFEHIPHIVLAVRLLALKK